MSAIFKREFKSYFNTMTGFIFLAVIFAFTGIFTTAINLRSQSASFEYVLGNITIIFMLIVPVLAMRSIAEERRSRTDQLLYSLPIKTIDIVLGKYLSMTAVLLIACVGMAFVPVILSLFGIVHYGSCYAALLGFFLLGAALIAICMFMSSLTESQIIAAVTSFGVVLALYLMSGLASLLPTTAVGSFVAFLILGAAFGLIVWALTRDTLIGVIAAGAVIIPTSIFYFVNQEAFAGLFPSIISYLAVFDRFDVFVSGIFDLTAVVYYLSIIVFFVFLTVQSLEKRRWS